MRLFDQQSHRLKGAVTFGRESTLRINRLILLGSQKTPHDNLHFHLKSTQTFVVTMGVLVVEVNGKRCTLSDKVILEIQPHEKYRVIGHKGDTTVVVIGTHNEEADRQE